MLYDYSRDKHQIVARFAQITNSKTAIIVTHRLYLVMLADKIIVMKQGKLIEQGAHDGIVNMGCDITRLYKSKEQWYI